LPEAWQQQPCLDWLRLPPPKLSKKVKMSRHRNKTPVSPGQAVASACRNTTSPGLRSKTATCTSLVRKCCPKTRCGSPSWEARPGRRTRCRKARPWWSSGATTLRRHDVSFLSWATAVSVMQSLCKCRHHLSTTSSSAICMPTIMPTCLTCIPSGHFRADLNHCESMVHREERLS